jgi:SPP1 gp7 family putative phage head morphogenesis protein
MVDRAHVWTDWKIEQIEKELGRIYRRAEKELEARAEKYFKRFEELDKKQRALLDSGKINDAEYAAWRKSKMMTGKHWTDMKMDSAEQLLKVNQTATAYVNDQLPAVYVRNYNQVANGINGQIKGYSFELVDSSTVRRLATDNKTLLPYKYIDGVKDVRWNTQKVNSEILQGILQGDSIPNLAKRLRSVTEMNRTSAVRNARTSCTSAENKGRMDMLHDAEDKGVQTKKVWMATNDNRTREAHAALDGVEAFVDEEFEMFGMKIMYPGDPNADPEMIYNCRCSLGYKVIGFWNR